MNLYDTSVAVLQTVSLEQVIGKNVQLLVKRDDLIDPEVSGNKWRKLLYNIELATFQQRKGILTFGGAYSNHLLATAAACHKAGLHAVGVVRGEELHPESNENLKRCAELGMELQFVDRTTYSERNEPLAIEGWKERYPNHLLVAEGGHGFYGMLGCQKMWEELPADTDHVFVALGTGTTAAGLLVGLPDEAYLHAVPVLKGFDTAIAIRELLWQFYLDGEMVDQKMKQLVVHDDFHFGGYGKADSDLKERLRALQTDLDVPLDYVYTGKALLACLDFIQQSENAGKVVFIHTGGLHNAAL
ncbi:MAG: 1-aminocyclopropane-1-carboxylate deaminase/D-cysteine desulfhydrase [Fluviicola sp.]